MRKMSLEKFVAHGRKAQAAVDAAVNASTVLPVRIWGPRARTLAGERR